MLNPTVPAKGFVLVHPTIANTMEICIWFTNLVKSEGWPVVSAERFEMCKTNEFRAGLSHGLTLIDGLKTLGVTMLHEVYTSSISCRLATSVSRIIALGPAGNDSAQLTHTNQRGMLVDIPESQRLEGVNSYIGWRCVGALKISENPGELSRDTPSSIMLVNLMSLMLMHVL